MTEFICVADSHYKSVLRAKLCSSKYTIMGPVSLDSDPLFCGIRLYFSTNTFVVYLTPLFLHFFFTFIFYVFRMRSLWGLIQTRPLKTAGFRVGHWMPTCLCEEREWMRAGKQWGFWPLERLSSDTWEQKTLSAWGFGMRRLAGSHNSEFWAKFYPCPPSVCIQPTPFSPFFPTSLRWGVTQHHIRTFPYC